MSAFLVKRLGFAIVTLWAVLSLVFVVVRIVPGDPAQVILGDQADAAAIAAMRTRLGLDASMTEQYTSFLAGAVRGDWGVSLVTGRPVILIFDGCYHGMVDDAFVVLKDGAPVMKPGLLGQVQDLTATTRVVPFNDLTALEAALAPGDVAAVLAEPVMTNCGMILPEPGFLEALRRMTREAGTLLVIDETHTISTGPGGYTRAHGLEPDVFVLGKAVAGGVPAAVWGVTAEFSARMDEAQQRIGSGQSGIGTTLSGNALAIAAMRAMLTEVMTDAAYGKMLAGAERLVAGLQRVVAARKLPWSVVHVGARVELVFADPPPKNAAQMRKVLDHEAVEALHLWLINRGVLIAPFHNMMLVSPVTEDVAIDRLVAAVDGFAAAMGEME